MEGQPSGTLRLGISTFRGTAILPSVLARFYSLYPNARIQVIEADSLKLEEMTSNGLLDISIVAQPSSTRYYQEEPFFQDELMLMTSKKHPVEQYIHLEKNQRYPWVNLKDLSSFEFALGPENTIQGKTARHLFQEASYIPHCTNYEMNSFLSLALAETGTFLVFTYKSVIVNSPNNACYYMHIGPEGVPIQISFLFPYDSYRSKATLALKDLLMEKYKAFGNVR